MGRLLSDTHRTRRSLASRLVLLALAISKTAALSQQYCASFNTGTGTKKNSDNFMTNGKCHDQCSGYAFAVVQFKDCWCTNVAPGGADPGSECSKACPGYPYENCGNADQGLYGYVALGPAPSSTQGGSTSSSSPSQTAASSVVQQPTPSTIAQTSSTTSRYIPVSIPLDTSTSTPTTSSTSTTSSSSSTWSPTPVVTVETVTGQVQTLTVTPSEPPQETQTVIAQAAASNANGFWSSSGKVAGTFVAVAVIVAAIAGLLVFLLWRRKRRNQQQETLPSTAGSGTPQRRPSRMSQMGLLGSQRARNNNLPEIQTTGWGPGNSAEKSPADTLDKRSSYPRMVDQRLEPTALWNPLHNNGSHVSVGSFRDDQDYSRRMLRVANPDAG